MLYIKFLKLINKMTEEAEFQDWETEAENIVVPEKIQIQTNDNSHKQPIDNKQENKQKAKPIDPKKILQEKIKKYKEITEDNYEQYFQEVKKDSTNAQIKVSNQILKNDKDFVNFGKLVAKKFVDYATDQQLDTLDQNHLFSFIDETLFLLYNQLESKNLHIVKDKLIIAKGQRKKVEKEEKKKQDAEERKKRQQKALQDNNEWQKKQQKKIEDDMFGGATLITSKQVQDQRKNKDVKAVPVSKKEESDDDDFM